MRTDGQTDGHADMMKLIVAFRNFENAPKNKKKCKLKLKYNYSVINNFSSKTNPSTYPTQGSLVQIRRTYYFSKKIKQRETIKIIPRLEFILVPKINLTTKIKKNKCCGHERVKTKFDR
jgi:hypothetical protein